MELPGKRKRGSLEKRFMDAMREDMAEVEVTEEDTDDRNKKVGKSTVATPGGRSRKEKKIRTMLHTLLHESTFMETVKHVEGHFQVLIGRTFSNKQLDKKNNYNCPLYDCASCVPPLQQLKQQLKIRPTRFSGL